MHSECLNPLKRVNSILTHLVCLQEFLQQKVSIPSSGSIQFLHPYRVAFHSFRKSLNPLKRVNSILTWICSFCVVHLVSLNPLKRVNSILTLPLMSNLIGVQIYVSIPSSGSIQFLHYQSNRLDIYQEYGLNPLKRVNSILTVAFSSDCGAKCCEVKKDSDDKRWVEGVGGIFFDLI